MFELDKKTVKSMVKTFSGIGFGILSFTIFPYSVVWNSLLLLIGIGLICSGLSDFDDKV